MVEHLPCKQKVACSIHAVGFTFYFPPSAAPLHGGGPPVFCWLLVLVVVGAVYYFLMILPVLTIVADLCPTLGFAPTTTDCGFTCNKFAHTALKNEPVKAPSFSSSVSKEGVSSRHRVSQKRVCVSFGGEYYSKMVT